MPNRRARLFLVACCVASLLTAPISVRGDEGSPPAKPTLVNRLPAFQDVARANAAQLSALPAQEDALSLFKTAIGPQLGLGDAAMTVGAKGLTPAMSQELLISDLTRAANELLRGLAAWQLVQAIRDLGTSGTAESRQEIQKRIEAQMAWLSDGTTLAPALERLQTLSAAAPTEETAPLLGGAVAQIEAWAIDTVHREWFRIYNWKDQVRQQRGLVRLCGTWQWSIHNHQNHREEKTAVIFAPPGSVSATSPAEIIVLGDSVYLRWETRAGVQEDSLLFSGEGQRLEGTFVNTAGGWGSITGKRTATCFNDGGKPSSPRRQHH
ncbi:MAG: hypothetical protein ABS70_08435 [Nitrospira sp. SCN 59-13]|nr:MAG: hypothetical protein ABS70_08435 [Nitrospira sp. SCN 59-13]